MNCLFGFAATFAQFLKNDKLSFLPKRPHVTYMNREVLAMIQIKG